jgi:hypothetical protein
MEKDVEGNGHCPIGGVIPDIFCLEGPKETMGNLSQNISVPTRIWTEHLQIVNQELCCVSYLVLQNMDKNKMEVDALY